MSQRAPRQGRGRGLEERAGAVTKRWRACGAVGTECFHPRRGLRAPWSQAGMAERGRELARQGAAVLPELCCLGTAAASLMEVLRSLVALTDPQEGKLAQSQEKALKLLGVWQTVFAAIPSKPSVER